MDEEEDDDEEVEDEEIERVENNSVDGNEFNEVNLNQPNVSINCSIDDIEPVIKEKVSSTLISPFIGDSIWLPIKHYSDTSSLR